MGWYFGTLQNDTDHENIKPKSISRECAEQINHIIKRSKKISEVIFHDLTYDTNCFLKIERIAEIFFKYNQSVVNKKPLFCDVDKDQFSNSFEESSTRNSSFTSSERCSLLISSLNENDNDNKDYHDQVVEQFYWHGKCQQEITEYFSKFDLKRNVIDCRVIKPDQLNDSSKVFKTIKQNKKKSIVADPIQPQCLNNISNEDKIIYKNALKCALLPLTINADEPCDFSPVPLKKRNDSYCIDFTSIDRCMIAGKLQKAFQCNHYLKDLIETELSNSFSECSELQILADDIDNQKKVLISNLSVFYNHDDPYYNNWKQLQLNRFDRIISNNLVCSPSKDKNVDTTNYHDQFEILIKNLLKQDLNEGENKSEERTTAQVLTTTSLNILKQFGLRFGVGKVFMKVAIFSIMVNHCFSYNDFYLYCLENCLRNTTQYMESRNKCYFLKEKKIMEDALEILHLKLEYCFLKILDFYDKKILSDGGFSTLVELLRHTINAKHYFKLWELEDTCDLTQSMLTKYMKVTIENYYSKKKSQSENLTSQPLLYLLKEIMLCFKKVQDIFKTEHFDMYKILHKVVANTLYNELMKDVQVFFQQIDFTMPVDQDVLHLVYSLNKLDEEWNCFINRSAQTWRNSIKAWLPDIIEKVSFNIQFLIQIFIKKDNFCILQFKEKVKSLQETQDTHKLFNHDPSLSPFASIEQINEDQIVTYENETFNAESDIVSHNKLLSNSSNDLVVNNLLTELLDQIENSFYPSFSYVSEGPCTENQKNERLEKMLKDSLENKINDSIINEVLSVSEMEDSFVKEKIHDVFETIEGSNKNQETVNKKQLSILQNDLLMVTSSFSDILSCCFELINFARTFFFTIYPSRDLLQNKNIDLLRQIYTIIGSCLKKYSSSLLLLDICGVERLNEKTNKKLNYYVEKKFLTDLDELKKSVGCRHSFDTTVQSLKCKGSCIILQTFFEVSRIRLEPITRQMCYRINNIYSLLCVLQTVQKESADSFNVSLDSLLPSKDKTKTSPINDKSKLCSELMMCEKHIKQVFNVQLMLLVSRFFHDILNQILLEETKTMQMKIYNLGLILNSIIKIFKKIGGDVYSKILDQQVIIMFRLRILLDEINPMKQNLQTMYQTTRFFQDVVERSLLTYEEVILSLKNSLPKKFTVQEFIEKLRSNINWLDVLQKHSDEENGESCMTHIDFEFCMIGQSLLSKKIIERVQTEPATNFSSSFISPCFASESLTSDGGNFNEELRFTQAFTYKFTSKKTEPISKIYFYGTLYLIARKHKFWIHVFMDDILNILRNCYKYNNTLDLKFFIDHHSKSKASKDSIGFFFKNLFSCM
ncbi:uncharacterized protein LOC100197594 isoform X2 [Hydra vulgaris]|uniref:uncharacterized protein LOC100197594 isoform X2 n=1 Tax=Hydra vulgaris TaxID=6087 RepID=UPI001F5EE57B|nr:uncharacterized protein LOC100197594 isoform X2 [Hydra vulgaris]